MQQFQLIEVDVKIFIKRHLVKVSDSASVQTLCGHKFPLERVRTSNGSRNNQNVCQICHGQWQKAKRQ